MPIFLAIDVAVGKYGNCIDKLVDDVKTSSRHSSVQEAVGVNNGGKFSCIIFSAVDRPRSLISCSCRKCLYLVAS